MIKLNYNICHIRTCFLEDQLLKSFLVYCNQIHLSLIRMVMIRRVLGKPSPDDLFIVIIDQYECTGCLKSLGHWALIIFHGNCSEESVVKASQKASTEMSNVLEETHFSAGTGAKTKKAKGKSLPKNAKISECQRST
jgi:hypothetical protein